MTKLETYVNDEVPTITIPVALTINVDSMPDDIYIEINGRTIKISKQKLEKLVLTLQE